MRPLIPLALALLSTCSAAPETEPAAQLTAVQVGETLRQTGLPFEHEVTPRSVPANPKAGILSSAYTATADADVSITVYASPTHRDAAKARVEARLPGFTAYAQCGAILVQVADGTAETAPAHAVEIAVAAQAILRERFGPCD